MPEYIVKSGKFHVRGKTETKIYRVGDTIEMDEEDAVKYTNLEPVVHPAKAEEKAAAAAKPEGRAQAQAKAQG